LHAYEGRLPAHSIWFGEDQGRYVLEVDPNAADDILARAKAAGLTARVIGTVGGDAVSIKGEAALALGELREAHEGWLPGYMGKTIA
jgi:phosphoribosylformylglycinamidine synthase